MEGFSLLGAMVKVVLVIGLLVVVRHFLGRLQGGTGTGRPGRPAGRPVDVIARSALGRRAALVVVRVGADHFALGVTDEQVTVIGPVDIDPADASPATPALPAPPAGTQAGTPQPSWKEFVERLRERTVRH